jgi:hypothetical protein
MKTMLAIKLSGKTYVIADLVLSDLIAEYEAGTAIAKVMRDVAEKNIAIRQNTAGERTAVKQYTASERSTIMRRTHVEWLIRLALKRDGVEFDWDAKTSTILNTLELA